MLGVCIAHSTHVWPADISKVLGYLGMPALQHLSSEVACRCLLSFIDVVHHLHIRLPSILLSQGLFDLC